jgi:formate dehydrogenase major subunit
MVEKTTGCPKETFLKVAETILANSGADRTTSFAYAVAWTQHTYGVQIIGACALLQLLLGNIGRPGAGVMALRGHASIQGSTDIPTLYHSIQAIWPHRRRSRSTTPCKITSRPRRYRRATGRTCRNSWFHT